uniref:ARAD1C11220p n=1 Tax=Blastobotrys adeninivorans TaxID=409370 RepID=A0A060T0U4_BLAAD
MQFSIAALTTLIAVAAAEKVGIQVLRSGSQYHLSFVKNLDGSLAVGKGDEFTPEYEDGQLTLDGKYVAVDENQKSLYLADKSSGEFSEKDGYLAYNGDTAFSTVFSQNQQAANVVAGSTDAQGSGPISLVLRKMGNPTNSTGNTTTVHHNSTAAATQTVVQTVTSCGQQGCVVVTQTGGAGQASATGVQQVNGAAKVGGAAAAVFGAVAAALL